MTWIAALTIYERSAPTGLLDARKHLKRRELFQLSVGQFEALHFMHYNFCRVHQLLRKTPAMAAGLTDHGWSLEAIAALAG